MNPPSRRTPNREKKSKYFFIFALALCRRTQFMVNGIEYLGLSKQFRGPVLLTSFRCLIYMTSFQTTEDFTAFLSLKEVTMVDLLYYSKFRRDKVVRWLVWRTRQRIRVNESAGVYEHGQVCRWIIIWNWHLFFEWFHWHVSGDKIIKGRIESVRVSYLWCCYILVVGLAAYELDSSLYCEDYWRDGSRYVQTILSRLNSTEIIQFVPV